MSFQPSEIIRYPNFTTFVKPPSRCSYNMFIDTMQLSSAGSRIVACVPLCLLLVGVCLKKQFQIFWVSLKYWHF